MPSTFVPEALRAQSIFTALRGTSSLGTDGRLLKSLCLSLPVLVGAEAAVLANEHLPGLRIVFQDEAKPARRDVRELAAAGMEVRREMAPVVPSAVEGGNVVDRSKEFGGGNH